MRAILRCFGDEPALVDAVSWEPCGAPTRPMSMIRLIWRPVDGEKTYPWNAAYAYRYDAEAYRALRAASDGDDAMELKRLWAAQSILPYAELPRRARPSGGEWP